LESVTCCCCPGCGHEGGLVPVSDKDHELVASLIAEMRSLRLAIEHKREQRCKYDSPLTRDQAAKYLGVHPDTIYKWAVH